MTRKTRSNRRKDTVINGVTSKLGVRLTPDLQSTFVVAWVNDIKNRLQEKYNLDWDYVTHAELDHSGDPDVTPNDDPGSRVSKIVSSDGQRAFLMKKRKTYYDADQKEKQNKLDEVDKQIRDGDRFRFQEQYGNVKLGRKTL